MIGQRATCALVLLSIALTVSPARAGVFFPGDHFVYVAPPDQYDYVGLSLSGANNTCPSIPLPACGSSAAAADIGDGELHAYGSGSFGGTGGAVAALSVPIIISGPVTTGIATLEMAVHGSWEVGTYTVPFVVTTEGYAQYEAILYDYQNPGAAIDHVQRFGDGHSCGISDGACIGSLFVGTGAINDTLTLDVPFDLSISPLIQLTAYLYATGGQQATMDLSHTATFSISVPDGDTYSTILGSGTSVPEPRSTVIFVTGAIALVLARRGRQSPRPCERI